MAVLSGHVLLLFFGAALVLLPQAVTVSIFRLLVGGLCAQ